MATGQATAWAVYINPDIPQDIYDRAIQAYTTSE